MGLGMIQKPIMSVVKASQKLTGSPEITDVNYDLWMLRITLKFEGIDHPVYVKFDGIRGFRVLDEGDLLEFWNNNSTAESWLWRIESGGWRDLEKNRDGFLTGASNEYPEFLVGGINDCVSVIAYGDPKIEWPEP